MNDPGRRSSLAQWLVRLETLHPKKIDMSLDRIRRILRTLSLDVPPFRVIAVGGTNGKGSCVAYLASIYANAGQRVGAFTSPHLVAFNERIAVNGEYAADDEIVAALAEMDEARGDTTLSYFESSAVAALLHFAHRQVEVALLEVGMGGRLDAVNALDSDAALIASVGLDHQEWLGGDREAIGFEKAGIVRAGRPAVIADPSPPNSLVGALEKAGADAFYVGRDFDFRSDDGELLVSCRDGSTHRIPKPRYGGAEQWRNAAACVQLVQCLQSELPADTDVVARGIAQTSLPGRMQWCPVDGVEWVFDVAHNPAAAQCLAAVLAARPAQGRTFAVFAAMRDKDIAAIVRELAGEIDAWNIVGLDYERGATTEEIAAVVHTADAAATIREFDDVESACALTRAQAVVGDRVVVFGSFYLVGPALSALGLYSALPGSAARTYLK